MLDNSLQKGLIVTSNEIIHAKYHFSLWQKRVFMYFVSKIEKDATEFGMQKVQIADLVRFFETEQNGTVTDIIEKIPKQLYETSIQVPYRDEEGNERFGEIRLVTKYTKPQDKSEGNAYIELKFNEDLKPHLLDLKKQFSKYELRHIVHLQSAHAIRIYEILKSHQFKRQIELDVDYLKSILEVDTKYKLYADFKRKIIEKSQEDLLKNCDIAFTFQEVKAGKKVIALKFSIFENQPNQKKGKSASNNTENIETVDANTALDADRDALFIEIQPVAIGEWGVSPTRLLELIGTFSTDQIRQAFRVTERKAKSGLISSKAGFFIEAIQKGYSDDQELNTRKKAKVTEKATDLKKAAQNAQVTLEATLKTMREEINQVIRNLVEADNSVRLQAIDNISKTKNPVLQREMEQYSGQPTEQDFRDNTRLREAIIWDIVAHNAEDFKDISQRYAPTVKTMLDNLVKYPEIEKPRYEIRLFLNLLS
jgi:plasmid replication initiation protein